MGIPAMNSSPCLSVTLMMLIMLEMLIVVCTVKPTEAITANVNCNKVNNYFIPCIGYLINRSTRVRPSIACCRSVKSLNAASRGLVRVGVCECLKINARRIGGLNQRNAATLPGKCGVRINLRVSPTTNCRRA
ncbi:hypothetical protein KP509_13G068200 [Ceratopteris richardii]|uniref:Bifunctional inhibitor/plant lipid transfer protein/seed storage helical domain-containing protein n=1 Tax=Ceratopteris richardii TaxID=49495 RepID=A0A8T2TLZ5_CERRI|nr:hypothetical protein KP509_13G068200 [Ceratopteris richardii]